MTSPIDAALQSLRMDVGTASSTATVKHSLGLELTYHRDAAKDLLLGGICYSVTIMRRTIN